MVRLVKRGRPVILAYHNVIPAGEPPGGDRSLHLPRETFGRHLDLLTRTHRVVSLDTILDSPSTHDTRPMAAVTFDDGYRGALTAGLEELRRRDLPATFFVCPGLLGAHGLWWDELAVEEVGGVPDQFSGEALTSARGEAEEVYRLAAHAGLRRREQPRHAGVATEAEIREAAAAPGVALGSHSWSHPSLDRLDGTDLRQQLDRSLRWLVERFGDHVIPWVSLPYGRTGPNVLRAAREAGYARGLRISGGLVRPEKQSWALDRVNIPSGASLDGFALRTVGV